ncbi:DUF4145 domain-containing protein [Sulfoacidibacillus ferrooxidans]|uniref:DUF4145 domain-containing protein n=1 Tax=Sulfoacidibacillus ferrooxidans TaxID=2005001 RepID=A0A9X1VAR3_9BACL|nr:DUF4145 domain-containing protein [Sulfoacidibacillus ferrooxidans]MCI0184791.1 hypothetical protein [Sulfoacidibacillus ferrooxidans]
MDPLRENIYCATCKRKQNHEIVLKHEVRDFDPEYGYDWYGEYYIVQCRGCDNVHFASIYCDNTMINEEGDYFKDLSVYPPEPERKSSHYWTIEAKSFTSMPSFLSKLYGQVVDAYNDKSLLLSAIGLRAIVEAICLDLKVKKGIIYKKNSDEPVMKDGNYVCSENLEGKINGLVEGGFLVKKQASVLHQIRELGNYAAHEIKEPQQITIKSGVEVIESIVHSIYELDTYRLETKK